MDFFLILSDALILLKKNKPDVFFLIAFLLAYLLAFLFFVFLKKVFRKKKKEISNKKEFFQNQRNVSAKSKESKMSKNEKENFDVGFLDYVLGAKDIAHFIWIRKKINKDNKISIPLHQAVYLIRHYPEYFYYAGEKQNILFEKINRKIFASIGNKNFEIQDKKISTSDDLKKIELQNHSKVLLDKDGIIQGFISAEDENKKIAEKVLNDLNGDFKTDEVEKVEDKKEDLDFKMKSFFNEQPEIHSKENEKSQEEIESKDETRPMTKKELKEKIRKQKKAKQESSDSQNLDIEMMEDIIDSILKKSDLESEEKKKNPSLEKKEFAQPDEKKTEKEDFFTETIEEEKSELIEKASEVKTEIEDKMSFDIESSNLLFLKEKAKKQDFGKTIFLLDEDLVFDKGFFEEFLKDQNANSNQRSLLLKNLIRKFELSYDIQILQNQEVCGYYKDREIEGKFYIIKLNQKERMSIEKNIL